MNKYPSVHFIEFEKWIKNDDGMVVEIHKAVFELDETAATLF